MRVGREGEGREREEGSVVGGGDEKGRRHYKTQCQTITESLISCGRDARTSDTTWEVLKVG